MNNFINPIDELSQLLDKKAEELYLKMKEVDIQSLDIPDYCKYYLAASHLNRLFFSIQTSAALLYKSLTKKNMPVEEITLMDYGAGVGTLFMLAKLIGCKTVIYNDHLPDWKQSAQKICQLLDIGIDEYVVGGIEDTFAVLKQKNYSCNIITSRNVVEHIYKLDEFYSTVYKNDPGALIYSSTTANYYNPASRIKHNLLHKKWEKIYREKRRALIIGQGVEAKNAELLAGNTRGLALKEFEDAVTRYKEEGTVPFPADKRMNTCDPSNGVWAEHLLTMEEYRALVNPRQYRLSFEPGFWDTHYAKGWKNIMGYIMNSVGNMGKAIGMTTAPFIYVIAEPIVKNETRNSP